MLLLLACTTGGKLDSDTGNLEPTLTNVQAAVFVSCAFDSCHGASNAGGLSLVEGESYGELVGVAAVGDSSKTLVVAGDSASSYLVQKLVSDTSIVGDPMPPSAQLEQYRIELVEAWIAAGALDN
jgi:hypothetical protein